MLNFKLIKTYIDILFVLSKVTAIWSTKMERQYRAKDLTVDQGRHQGGGQGTWPTPPTLN